MARWHQASVAVIAVGLFAAYGPTAKGGQDGLASVRAIAPGVLQDLRYGTAANFTGTVVPGYQPTDDCRLAPAAADALARVQLDLQREGLSLLVFDCFRPKQAVDAFVTWSRGQGGLQFFYPSVAKDQLFAQGYIARQSAHSLGTAVDLTLVSAEKYDGAGDPPVKGSCLGAPSSRLRPGELDMGTSFDCFDKKSWTAAGGISAEASRNRRRLRRAMEAHGFRNYAREWWHFGYVGSAPETLTSPPQGRR